jgi:dienelactone hydrolase
MMISLSKNYIHSLKFYLVNLLCYTFALFLVGCSGNPPPPQHVDNLPGFNKILVKGGDFWITTYQHITDRDRPYVFYLEGDGNISNHSTNPTPRQKMLTSLVALDQRPNVIYVARPCQFTEIITALNEVITNIHNSSSSKSGKFSLVGYSGGGGIAVLIAARNPQVKDIITIAGNLDHIAFNQYNHSMPMRDSLNPIDYARDIRNIPQLHLSGEKDVKVPTFIGGRYRQISLSPCVKHQIIPSASHSTGWDQVWPEILARPLTCY